MFSWEKKITYYSCWITLQLAVPPIISLLSSSHPLLKCHQLSAAQRPPTKSKSLTSVSEAHTGVCFLQVPQIKSPWAGGQNLLRAWKYDLHAWGRCHSTHSPGPR